MNLKQLEHLLAVAETGSFSRAALQLHLTQPALSRSIQLLEAELDARLIDRMGRRNELTPLGLAVASHAQRLLLEASELRRNAALLKQGHGGSIRVGLGSGPGVMLMSPFLVHMARQHPGARVAISRGAIEMQLLQLRQRVLDALVIDTRSVVPSPDLNIEPISEMRAGFVCRRGHPLLAKAKKRQAVTFDDVLRYPLASTPLADEVAHILTQCFGPQANPQQAVRLCCEEIASLLDTVRASDAIFLGIVAAARAGIASGELKELATKPRLASSTRFALITISGRTEAPAMALFRQFVAQQLHD